jgi:hypothetical protein
MWELLGIAALTLLIFGVVAVWWNHLDRPPPLE